MANTPKGYNGLQPILPSDVNVPDSKTGEGVILTDQAAASLVIGDYNLARNYLEEQAWFQQWEENNILYDAPLIANMDDPNGAAVPRFTVNNHSNTMADACRGGLFAQKPPFFFRPRGKTTQGVADAWTALIDALLDRMSFRYWVGEGILTQSLHGTAVWKSGWSKRPKLKRIRKQKAAPESVKLPMGEQKVHTSESDDFTVETKTVMESFPWIEERMLGTTFFDPGWRTPNRPDLCGYVIDVDYVTFHDLQRMRNEACYTIPDEEFLTQHFFSHLNAGVEAASSIEIALSNEGSATGQAESQSRPTTVDPHGQVLMLIERTDAERVHTLLQVNGRSLVIQNHDHKMGRIPHFAANWRSKKNAGWGMGMGRLTGADQRLEQGTVNLAISLLAYQLNPAILHARGENAPTGDRTIRAGGFIGVDPIGNDVRNAMAVMDMPKVPAEAWQMIQVAKADSQENSGADSSMQQGQVQSKQGAARTATGAGRIAAKSDQKVQTPVENIELGLFLPFLGWLIDQVKVNMPTAEIRDILNDKLSTELLQAFEFDQFIDADIEVEMVAAAKLAAKSAMAQQLPWLMQIFQQPQLLEQLHMEGKTISLDVLLDVLFAVSEYRIEDQIIVPLTDDEKKHMMSMNQGQQKVQGDITKEQVKGQQAIQLEEVKAQHNLANTVVEKALERSGEGIPLARAAGLVARGDAEQRLLGSGPNPVAES